MSFKTIVNTVEVIHLSDIIWRILRAENIEIAIL